MSFDILLPEAEEVSTDSNVQEESNPIVTIKDALNANLIPLSKLSMFGMNWSKRKDLNARIVRNDNRMLVVGNTTPKTFMHDGRANITRIKSKRFQPSAQYCEKPFTWILTIASNRNSKVNMLSTMSRLPPWLGKKPLINIMPVLMSTNTSIIISFVKIRLTIPILHVTFSCF